MEHTRGPPYRGRFGGGQILNTDLQKSIAALGVKLGPDILESCQALFAAEQRALASGVKRLSVDLSYGSHPRQQIDFYTPLGVTTPTPVLVWVHGGGFVRGEKSSPHHPFNAHVGYWAARSGFLGAVMNYRLAPEFGWPAGGEDVGHAVDYIKRNAAFYGGDPGRILLAGTSAGAAHISTYLQSRTGVQDVCGAVLLSGLYGATPMEGSDPQYFGTDESLYYQRASLEGVAKSTVPLLVVSAEFDPPRFQTEAVALMNAVLRVRGRLPRMHYASGHNHYTLAMHLGSQDTRLANEIQSFARECCLKFQAGGAHADR